MHKIQAKARLVARSDAEEIEEEVRQHRNFKPVVALADKLLSAQHNLKAKAMGFDRHQREALAKILKDEVGVDVAQLIK